MSAVQAGGGHLFFKMCGSGNDFVFLDARGGLPDWARDPELIRRVCSRRTGVGADGIVYLADAPGAAFGMTYINSDGSPAAFCGNAALCSVALAAELGVVERGKPFTFASDAGVVTGTFVTGRGPEVVLGGLGEVTVDFTDIELGVGERRIGYASAGVPHLVVLCSDADSVRLSERGSALRWHPSVGRDGANVDFISAIPGAESDGGSAWRMRTFERGVEGETLACGSGAIASALLGLCWGAGGFGSEHSTTTIRTSSGKELQVKLLTGTPTKPESVLLRGEGRIVFTGELRDY